VLVRGLLSKGGHEKARPELDLSGVVGIGAEVPRRGARASGVSQNLGGFYAVPGAKKPSVRSAKPHDKIKRKPNGKEDLLRYVQSASPPKVREFTKFMATDIATCVHPWSVQKDVDARLAPLQILDNWEKHKADVKAASPKPSPRNSPRAPDESLVGTPRATKPGKEKQTEVEKERAQVREQCIKQREENPEAICTIWVYMAKKEKPKGTPQKTAQIQTKMGDYLGKKPTSTPTRKLTAEEVHAAVGMEIDDEVTESNDGILEVLAQREEEVMGPSAGADDSPKGKRKQADKKGLAPLENTVTEGLITAAEAKRRARRTKEEEEAQEQQIQTAVRILHCLRQNSTCPLPPLTAAGRAVKYSRKHS
jgi:hypothetical protein